jgi:hypothetical protein
MAARFDHLVVAVEDLDEAADRWRAAGLPAERGGAHPVGTENVLVRGPGAAYVELIAAGSDESNPWLDRIRSARGPISWAVAVDDLDEARTSLLAAGFDPGPPVPGSRRTPDGELLEWRVCDVGPGPYDGSLPFVIEWTTPMGAGPADGPVVVSVVLTPPDPDRVSDLLVALGLDPVRHGAQLGLPIGEPADDGSARWSMVWDDDGSVPAVTLELAVPGADVGPAVVLDGVALVRWPVRLG